MIDRVDTNQQGRLIILGFREYRHRGGAQGVRFCFHAPKPSKWNHITSAFVIPTSAFVIWKMSSLKWFPGPQQLLSLVKTFTSNNWIQKRNVDLAGPEPKSWRSWGLAKDLMTTSVSSQETFLSLKSKRGQEKNMRDERDEESRSTAARLTTKITESRRVHGNSQREQLLEKQKRKVKKFQKIQNLSRTYQVCGCVFLIQIDPVTTGHPGWKCSPMRALVPDSTDSRICFSAFYKKSPRSGSTWKRCVEKSTEFLLNPPKMVSYKPV